MPKKFRGGENSKAVEARERKESKKQEEVLLKQQAVEDTYWADDHKETARKQERKDERERKRLEQLERKKELQRLADEEMDSLKAAKPKAAAKITRANILAREEQERLQAEQEASKSDQLVHTDLPLEENVNLVVPAGEEARTVEEALSLLSVKDPAIEKHPEKRVKAAYLKFEEDNLPRLKQENPNMRLSQLKQLLKKDWMKSPQNPLNQRFQDYNEKR